MHMQVCVFIQCRQVYAGCFPGDKYAGVRLESVQYAGSGGMYAYVGSYAGIASRDVYSMF